MTNSAARTGWTITLILVAIGVGIVVRRSIQLLAPSPAPPRFPEAAAMDAGFARHPVLTMVHIVPGLLFVLLGPLQFVRTLRIRRSRLHRWTGRIVMGAGAIIGVTALVMSPQMAIGGLNETVATMLFASCSRWPRHSPQSDGETLPCTANGLSVHLQSAWL